MCSQRAEGVRTKNQEQPQSPSGRTSVVNWIKITITIAQTFPAYWPKLHYNIFTVIWGNCSWPLVVENTLYLSGLELPKRLVYKNWEPGGEYTPHSESFKFILSHFLSIAKVVCDLCDR